MNTSRALLLAAVGCANTPDQASSPTTETATDAPCGVEPFLQLGTGVDEHQPLLPGGLVEISWTPGGIFRLQRSGRVVGLPPEVAVAGALVCPDGTIADDMPYYIATNPYDAETCTGEFSGIPLQIYDLGLCDWDGATCTLSVTVSSLMTDHTATSSLDVVLDVDPDASICQRVR